MNKQILSYCDAREVNRVASTILYEIKMKEWGADNAIQGIGPRLEKENRLLTEVIGDLRAGKYGADLQEVDTAFDKNFSCVKHFVNANRYVQDETISTNAEKLWEVIEAHKLNLHQKGYERQLSLINSLLNNFDKKEIQSAIQTLYGVPENIARLKKLKVDFENLFRKNIEEGATEEESIAPYLQKKVVRNILNRELLPYLNAMAAVLPEDYAELSRVIGGFVESVNTKARTRRKRNETILES